MCNIVKYIWMYNIVKKKDNVLVYHPAIDLMVTY